MILRNLLLICLMFIFVIACAPETSEMTEAQIADTTEASEATQDVADEHSDEEGEHDGEDSDEHSDEEGEHGTEDSDEHSDEEGEHGAEDEHEDGNERRELGAHEHGAAELMIAWSGSDVAIDLETPAYNILGFEYAPTSDEEKGLLAESVAALETGGLLQLSPDAGCTLVAANVETKFSEETHDEEGHDEGEEGESEEGHDEESQDSDEEGHDEEGHSEETHSNIDVSYNLECGAPENIESLDASNLFAQFPNFEEIQVQWISDTEQSATDLTSDNPVLAFK